MAKSKLTLEDKLAKYEQAKKELIEKREKEILKIIKATGSLSVDDVLLAGALLFLKDEKNKTHSILDEFTKYTKPKKKEPKSN